MDMAIRAKQLADEGKDVDEIFKVLEEKQNILFLSYTTIILINYHAVVVYPLWLRVWLLC